MEETRMYYFLKRDLDDLDAEINALCDRIRDIGREMGLSCQEGSETFHDNFVHEDGCRQQTMWSNRLRQLIGIRNQARVIVPNAEPEFVSLGMIFVLRDEETSQESIFQIGSYKTFREKSFPTVISYDSPLARAFMLARVGEAREVVIRGCKKSLEVVSINIAG